MALAFFASKNEKNNSGFIALVSIIILSGLIGILATILFHSALSEFSISSFQERGQKTHSLAEACLREAIFKLKENINYLGQENLIFNGKECLKINVEDISTSTKIVSVLVKEGQPPHYWQAKREIKYYHASNPQDWQKATEIENLEILEDKLKLAEGKIERITTSTSHWADYFSFNDLEIVEDSLRLLKLNGDYVTSGTRLSKPLSLDKIKEVKESQISWISNQPEGTEIKIKVATSSSSTTEPDPNQYFEATNGGSIPGINQGDDLTGKYLWVRQELNTTISTTTPILDDLRESILGKTKGHWLSLPIEISSSGKKIFNSQIFWKGASFFENFFKIETRFSLDGVNWSEWQEAKNGGKIPSLERGNILNSAFLQIKISFFGGPEIYPYLEVIKFFLELE